MKQAWLGKSIIKVWFDLSTSLIGFDVVRCDLIVFAL